VQIHARFSGRLIGLAVLSALFISAAGTPPVAAAATSSGSANPVTATPPSSGTSTQVGSGGSRDFTVRDYPTDLQQSLFRIFNKPFTGADAQVEFGNYIRRVNSKTAALPQELGRRIVLNEARAFVATGRGRQGWAADAAERGQEWLRITRQYRAETNVAAGRAADQAFRAGREAARIAEEALGGGVARRSATASSTSTASTPSSRTSIVRGTLRDLDLSQASGFFGRKRKPIPFPTGTRGLTAASFQTNSAPPKAPKPPRTPPSP
jgi:hypothetical protein